MKQREFIRIFGGIIVLLVILLGVLAVVQVASKSPLWSAEGAAWVQAIGSIAAIFGAYHLADRSHRRTEDDQKRRELEDEIRRIDTVMAAVIRVSLMCDRLIHDVNDSNAREVRLFRPETLKEEQSVLKAIPIMEIPDSILAALILNVVAVIETASHPFLRNAQYKRDEQFYFEQIIADGADEALGALDRSINAATNRATAEIKRRREILGGPNVESRD